MTLLILTHPIASNNNNISNSMTELRVSKYTRPILTSIHKKQKSLISLFFKTDKKEPKKSKYGYESAKVLPAENIKKRTRSSRLKKRHRLKNCEKKHSKRKCHRRRKRKLQREKAKLYRKKNNNNLKDDKKSPEKKATCCFKL